MQVSRLHRQVWVALCWVALCLIGLLTPLSGQASQTQTDVEVEGVHFPQHLDTEPRLSLVGAGLLRYRWVIKAYVAAFYQSDPNAAPDDPTIARRLTIEYFHDIAAEDFAEATLKGVEQNLSAQAFDKLKNRVAQFNRLYQDVKPGDRYTLDYRPSQGITLRLNNHTLGQLMDQKLAMALFAIWLGPNPVDEDLKADLLGKDN